jgi:hypothetical protein
MSKTARIEVRTDPEREALLKQAASLTNQTLTGFILDAAARRAERQAAQQHKAFDAYVRHASGAGGSADELTKLADLKSKGVITDAEFDAQKAKILS